MSHDMGIDVPAGIAEEAFQGVFFKAYFGKLSVSHWDICLLYSPHRGPDDNPVLSVP